MSTLGSVRTACLVGGAGMLGVLSLLTLLNTTPVTADSRSARRDDDAAKSNAGKTIVQREPIPYPTLRRSSSELRAGTSKTLRVGINGEKAVTYSVTANEDGTEKRQVLSSEVLKKPVPEIVATGRGKLASRGYFSGRRVITMSATGYSPAPEENGGNRSGRTATGLKIGHGVVAVDPSFIPLGTRLYIEGYGYAVAADTGGAIKGNRIDLGHETKREGNAFGRRKVKVHILD